MANVLYMPTRRQLSFGYRLSKNADFCDDDGGVEMSQPSARIPRQTVNVVPIQNKQQPSMPRPKGSKKRKSGVVVRRSTNNVVEEIMLYQQSTALLIQKLPFSRLVREICNTYAQSRIQTALTDYRRPASEDAFARRWTVDAMWCIQEAAEAFLTYMLEESFLFALHARRVTLMPRDVRLWKRIRGMQGFAA